MQTLTAPLPAIREVRVAPRPLGLARLISTYLFVLCILFLSVRGTFSFLTNANNEVAGTYGDLSGSGADTAVHTIEYALVYGVFALCIASRLGQVFSQALRNWLVFALPLLALASAAWSQVPRRSLIFAVFTLLNTLFAVYLSKRFDPKRQHELFIVTGVVICVLSMLTVALLPQAGIDHKGVGGDFGVAWQGIFPHKNICAAVLTYFVAAAITYKRGVQRFRVPRAIILAMMLLLIVMSKSRTGWIITGLVVAFIWTIRRVRRLGRIEKIFAILIIPLLCLAVGAVVYANLQDILPLLGKGANMTNRIPIWKASIASALKRPLLGFGYYAFWIGFKGEAMNTALMAGDPGLLNAENGILQMWLELGVVGLALLFVMLIRTSRNGWTCLVRGGRDAATEWFLAILFITWLSVGDGDKYMMPHSIEWTMYVLADIGLAAKARALRRLPSRVAPKKPTNIVPRSDSSRALQISVRLRF
jgi:exopolysaccharide production protein ExoQ